MIYSWDVPFLLTTRVGTLSFNDPDVWPKFMLVPAQCSAGWETRITKTNLPAAHGSLLRRRFATGAQVTLAIEAWESQETPACGSVLTGMMDVFRRHLWALLTDTQDANRLAFDVPGADVRMLDDCKLLDVQPAELVDNIRTRHTITLDSPYPYIMDEYQSTFSPGTVETVLEMTGSADFYPVMKAYGPFSDLLVSRNDLDGVGFYWSDELPGAPTIGSGDYIEFDFFRNTAYKNGSGANAMPGLNLGTAEFFPLTPGSNLIFCSEETDWLINQSWS